MRNDPANPNSPDGQAVAVVPRQVVESAGRERSLLRGLQVAAAGFSQKSSGVLHLSPPGTHSALLLYCVKGGGWCEAGGRLHTIRAGDLLVAPPGVVYTCGTHLSNPWAVHWVHALGDLLPDYLQEMGIGSEAAVCHPGEDPQLARICNDILKSLQRGNAFPQMLRAAQALAYLFALLIEKRQESAPEDSDNVQKVAETVIYMSEHLKDPLRVAALARSVSLSPTYFGELFKEQTGCSPRDYLHLLRIHRACQLLRSTNLSVKEVATQVGYQDPFHFSRQFKAFQRISPSEYREQR